MTLGRPRKFDALRLERNPSFNRVQMGLFLLAPVVGQIAESTRFAFDL
jgi:hypothetical protein